MEAILDILSQKMENRFRRYRDYCIKGEKSHKQRKTAGKKIADFIKFFLEKE